MVWLAPHEVVAKVGIWPHSADVLTREVTVCAAIASRGAPVAAPLGPLVIDAPSGLPVSLWKRLVATEPADTMPAADLALMLRRVHSALCDGQFELPSFLSAFDLARSTLFDDRRMSALDAPDRSLLRGAFDTWERLVRGSPASAQALHGEPHLGNIIVTEEGPHLVDFEAVSEGPPEWDLASLDEGVAAAYGAIDTGLLAVCRLLNSARVATWGWAQADVPAMREHGEHHLELVRRALAG